MHGIASGRSESGGSKLFGPGSSGGGAGGVKRPPRAGATTSVGAATVGASAWATSLTTRLFLLMRNLLVLPPPLPVVSDSTLTTGLNDSMAGGPLATPSNLASMLTVLLGIASPPPLPFASSQSRESPLSAVGESSFGLSSLRPSMLAMSSASVSGSP